ncbi:ABC transporter ATP-binding protein [Columbia Basin potato purple top phytoplasma]|uniref:ABC transporter ATP-binding protein/permease n=1 Tax=Columbia Basin potato purple top phytoplasma TaxID=307134 RepID=A0ABT5L8Y0_9MOLU|nr:ABC transporter ATP-binding protein [Columbia Basin potato purple top phytoplasma]MDC9032065.1 ABC transporter ATP-binding protein/permease [Columbia Basin potato purple top phytoplasma]
MKLILKYIFKYKKLLLLNISSFILIIIGELSIPYIVGRYIVKNQNNQTPFQTIFLCLCMLVCMIICGNLIVNFCISKISSLIFKDLSTDLFKKIQTFSFLEIQKLGVSAIVSRSTYNIYQIINFITTFYKTFIVTPIVLISCFIIIFKIKAALSYGILFIIPCFIIILILIIKKNYLLSVQQHTKLEEINYKIRSGITGTKIIRTLNQEQNEENKFEKINSNFRDLIIKLFTSILSIEPLFYLLLNLSVIITNFIASDIIFDKQINVGDLYICIVYNVHILSSILNFLLLFMMFPKTLIALQKIQYLFNIKPSINDSLANPEKLETIKKIEFKNVFYQYPNANKLTLKNINFKAKESEIIAFVGKTGSGKTTLLNLIPRLLDPIKGNIEINGIDIKKYDVKIIRNKIGFVSQKNILFKGTIYSNLLFSKETADSEEMLEKAKIAQSYEFIQNKSDKLKDQVSELGSNLSGGQKQRLSLTRVLLKQPDVYIFDDSFSALDYETELAIRQKFFEVKGKSIVIIVAQRLTSILNADKIIVLDEGQIVSMGKHKELINTCPSYQKIAISQKIKEAV